MYKQHKDSIFLVYLFNANFLADKMPVLFITEGQYHWY